MKRHKMAAVVTLASMCLAVPAYAIDFWHSSTVWAGQGQCSATFMFDSGTQNIRDMQVSVSAFDKGGRKVASDVLSIKEFGQSSAERYAAAHLEGDAICDDGLTIVVNKATAVLDGKRVNLLKMKTLTVLDFKPFKIRVAK